ncbi:hypothetical protein RJ641_029821 [Dillenia turbinata]|uniref:Uncharacterized protein n=1 Tax=Dillenia turbinata TaxID=194707 RepID=A0AAN8ZNE4_9MAGN
MIEKMDLYYQRMNMENPRNALLLGNYARFLNEVLDYPERAEEYIQRAILENQEDENLLSSIEEDGGYVENRILETWLLRFKILIVATKLLIDFCSSIGAQNFGDHTEMVGIETFQDLEGAGDQEAVRCANVQKEDNDFLHSIPTLQEVHQTILKMDKESAGGPDGSEWEVIGEDIYKVVVSFFCGVDLPWVPKISDP